MNRVKPFAVLKMTRCIEWGTLSSIHIAFVLSQAVGIPKSAAAGFAVHIYQLPPKSLTKRSAALSLQEIPLN
jgi:hypothetical protein